MRNEQRLMVELVWHKFELDNRLSDHAIAARVLAEDAFNAGANAAIKVLTGQLDK